jgi:phytoene dehydrogenase-like protein
MAREHFDVAILGGGHNGLVAAAYLARRGLSVRVLERLSQTGGAAISEQPFAGIDARLSRYSYLVSLLPTQLVRELELEIKLAPRRYSSYTPIPNSALGLLIDNQDQTLNGAQFERIGALDDFQAWQRFYAEFLKIARALAPTLLNPLQREVEVVSAMQEGGVASEYISGLMGQPIGELIAREFDNDWVRGVVMTDALIGTFAPNDDDSLRANRCFLYHLIGNGTGDWQVPIGGMGAVTAAMRGAALAAGAQITADAEVMSVDTSGDVGYRAAGSFHNLRADLILANLSPQELSRLTDGQVSVTDHDPDQGAQVKVNLLLSRLPKLRDGSVSPEAAFGGTFHINESWSQLATAYSQASTGSIPDVIPVEIYCHSLTDASILSSELQSAGVQTLTAFALHTPHSLQTGRDADQLRQQLQRGVLKSINSVLAEPIEPLLLLDEAGQPCIETKTTADLEQQLRLPAGNIFHGALQWPWVNDSAKLDTPAQRWGVATSSDKVLCCGSGARRGGAVSGLGGHNAAMAALELLA